MKYLVYPTIATIFYCKLAVSQSYRGIIQHEVACIEWQAPSHSTIAQVLQAWHLSMTDLLMHNPPLSKDSLVANQWLKIPVRGKLVAAACEGCTPVYHFTGKSEGLYRIGRWYGDIPVPVLKTLNGLKQEALATGQQLLTGYLPPPDAQVWTSKNTPNPPKDTNTLQPIEKGEAVQPDSDRLAILGQGGISEDLIQELTYQGQGFFADEWSPSVPAKKKSGKAASFKTSSGWTDGKYYVLNSQLKVGTVVMITHVANGRSLYARVVGPLPDIKHNEGLMIRISNAAAASLDVWDESSFEVIMEY